MNKKQNKTKQRHKRRNNGNQKYQIMISNYNFEYPVTSKFTVFYHVIITDNLQNLRFYERSSKNIDENMFCTKTKLLKQQTVLSLSLF